MCLVYPFHFVPPAGDRGYFHAAIALSLTPLVTRTSDLCHLECDPCRHRAKREKDCKNRRLILHLFFCLRFVRFLFSQNVTCLLESWVSIDVVKGRAQEVWEVDPVASSFLHYLFFPLAFYFYYFRFGHINQ